MGKQGGVRGKMGGKILEEALLEGLWGSLKAPEVPERLASSGAVS